MSTAYFTSTLDQSYLPRLEELLFFNANQSATEQQAIAMIHRYGVPRVVICGEKLRILCGESLCPQALFVMDAPGESCALIGVVVFAREEEALAVLHVAVHEDYTQKAQPRRKSLLLEMLEEVRNAGRRIKGIDSIRLFPGTARETRLPVLRHQII